MVEAERGVGHGSVSEHPTTPSETLAEAPGLIGALSRELRDTPQDLA